MDTSQSNYIALNDINIIHKAYQTDLFSQGRSAFHLCSMILISPIDPAVLSAEDIFQK